MKKYLCTLIFIVSLLNIPAWGQADYKHLYERKVRSYAKREMPEPPLPSSGGVLLLLEQHCCSHFLRSTKMQTITVPKKMKHCCR